MRRYVGTAAHLRNKEVFVVSDDNNRSLVGVNLDAELCRLSPGEALKYQEVLSTIRSEMHSKAGVYVLAPEGPNAAVLELLPKGALPLGRNSTGLTVEDLQRMWMNIFGRLQAIVRAHGSGKAIRLEETSTTTASFLRRDKAYKGILEQVLIGTLSTVESTLQANRPKTYRDVTETEPFLRGRVNWAQQSSKLFGLRHLHVVDYQEFDADGRLIEFIKAANARLSRSFGSLLQPGGRGRELLRKIDVILADVRVIHDIRYYEPLVRDFLRRPQGRFQFLRDAIRALAKWVFNLDLSTSRNGDECVECSLTGFKIDLSKLFEQWCRLEVARALNDLQGKRKKNKLYATSGLKHSVWYWGDSKVELQPDIVIFSKGKGIGSEHRVVHAIVDAKYKVEIPRSAKRDAEEKWSFDDQIENTSFVSGLARSDVYQLTSYMTAAASGSISANASEGITYSVKKVKGKPCPKGALILCTDEQVPPKTFSSNQDLGVSHYSIGVCFGAYLLDKLDGASSVPESAIYVDGFRHLLMKMFWPTRKRSKKVTAAIRRRSGNRKL